MHMFNGMLEDIRKCVPYIDINGSLCELHLPQNGRYQGGFPWTNSANDGN